MPKKDQTPEENIKTLEPEEVERPQSMVDQLEDVGALEEEMAVPTVKEPTEDQIADADPLTPSRPEALSGLSMPELQRQAKILGMPEDQVQLFNTKEQLAAIISSLQEKRAQALPKDSVESPNEVAKWKGKRWNMMKRLQSQPRKPLFIPLEGKEKPGKVLEYIDKNGETKFKVDPNTAVCPLTINGFTWYVPKGVFVDVPEQLAIMKQENMIASQMAGEQYSLDRTPNDSLSGFATVRQALE